MTEQQRLTIRAELARRMGITIEKRWQHVTDPTWCLYDVRLPGGTYLGSHCGSIEEAASKLPDPFTNAAANRKLVLWLKGQGNAVQANFWGELDLLINNPLLLIPVNGQLVYSPLEYLTLPLEAITLAAARALGIETE